MSQFGGRVDEFLDEFFHLIVSPTCRSKEISRHVSAIATRRAHQGRLELASATRKVRMRWRLTRSVITLSVTSSGPRRYVTVASVSGSHAARRRTEANGSAVGGPCTLPTIRYGPTSTSTRAVRVFSRRAASPRGPLATTAQISSCPTESSGIATRSEERRVGEG